MKRILLILLSSLLQVNSQLDPEVPVFNFFEVWLNHEGVNTMIDYHHMNPHLYDATGKEVPITNIESWWNWDNTGTLYCAHISFNDLECINGFKLAINDLWGEFNNLRINALDE